ncbi:hypothetical protein GGI19_004289 [Coemansia pectinata]|uniref:Uncharacterized protein n=1 Tax=Coemansia pectinata TaxID=1052879 RepID=A0A9W8GYN6_9FUNG|nr:hypothetical protein GGI19_004289 [Coemansia pectinata]
MQLIAIIPAIASVFGVARGICAPGACLPPSLGRRQLPPPNGGMGSRYNSPFAAFWNQGIVPGQGFPQVGMSAYGYGLPGLGLTQFLNPDVAILEGAGKGEINEHDLDNIDRQQYGLDRFKEGNNGPDPAYPGKFKNEDNDDNDDNMPQRHNHHHRHEYDSSAVHTGNALQLATLAAAVLLQFV